MHNLEVAGSTPAPATIRHAFCYAQGLLMAGTSVENGGEPVEPLQYNHVLCLLDSV